jgi:hypothetical protein
MYTPKGISCYSFQDFFLKTFTLFVLVNAIFTQQLLAQVTENFSDGEFTSSPAWSGTDSKFVVSAGQLKLQAPVVADFGYLSTLSQAINDASWEFFVRMDFNPSSTNFARIYLASDNADLSASPDGYYVMIGNTTDEISFYKQTGTTATKLIDGADGRLNLSIVTVKVQVLRDSGGNWQLFSDVGLTGTYTLEGTVNDTNILTSNHFGIYCEYTSTRSDKFYFDDILITGNPFVDGQPPVWEDIVVISSQEINLLFSEPLSELSAESVTNYSIAGRGNPESAELQIDTRTVRLRFTEPFQNGVESDLNVSGISDVAGNALPAEIKSFLFFESSPVAFKDVVISEIFPDYEPAIGLPSAEFLEIYNRSENPVSVENWTMTDGTSTATLPLKILVPGASLILCSTNSAAEYSEFGSVVGLSAFPTLNNSSDKIQLKDAAGNVIDSLAYTTKWYHDEDKQSGGWSIEIINPDDMCKDSENWKASIDERGGTPGSMNSVFEIAIDTTGPKLLEVIDVGPRTLHLVFDEKLSGSVTSHDNFSFTPPMLIDSIFFSDGYLETISVELVDTVQPDRMYTISASEIFDCPGNEIEQKFSTVFLHLDTIAPVVDSIKVISSTQLRLYFSEPILSAAAVFENYTLVRSSSHPFFTALENGSKSVLMEFSEPFDNGVEQRLSIRSLEDINGNESVYLEKTFLFFVPSPTAFRDVIVSEIFPDPSPVVGLPEFEFIELYNRSDAPIDLGSWVLTDRSSTGTLPSSIILPGEYVIVSAANSVALFAGYGKTLGAANFPTLNNSRDTVVLKDPGGNIIDSLIYSTDLYHDEDKKSGGWSLERIDPEDVCREGANWAASVNFAGGTPGEENSVYERVIDLIGPTIIDASRLSEFSFQVTFDEKLNDQAATSAKVSLDPVVVVDEIVATGSMLQITTLEPILEAKTYRIHVENIFDCPGNPITSESSNTFLNLDTIPPYILSASVLSSTEVSLTFSERLEEAGITAVEKYSLSDLSHPTEVFLKDSATLVLRFASSFPNGVPQALRLYSVADINGNVADVSQTFLFFEASPTYHKDVVITEIFADPAPVVGLPEAEFIELYNRSENPVNVENWQLKDGTSLCSLPSLILLPDEYAVLCGSSAFPKFSGFGKVLAVANFPSLNNSGEPLVLKTSLGVVIDSVSYSDLWYRDDQREEGGYSLELIDPENICADSLNWIASLDENGGTPSRQNSVFAEMPDVTGPSIESVVALSPDTLVITFNEKLEQDIPEVVNFSVSPAIQIASISFRDQSLRTLQLQLSSDLQTRTTYTLMTKGIYDCPGNEIPEGSVKTFALPERADSSDVVINEILFDPHPNGVDFIEIYNRSDKYIDLKNWRISNFADSLWNEKKITVNNFLLEPRSYLALTTDIEALINDYPHARTENILEVRSLPPMNDDEGGIALLGEGGNGIDHFLYSDKMHSVFLKNDEGVSLERVSFDEPTDRPANWKSANGSSGFATPGFKNSNSLASEVIPDEAIVVDPEVFQPQSGQADFTRIFYQFPSGGFVASVKILDSQGRQIKQIVDNETLGTEGFFRWDGDEDNGYRTRVGYYVVWVEIFDEKGTVKTFRKRVAVAGKF